MSPTRKMKRKKRKSRKTQKGGGDRFDDGNLEQFMEAMMTTDSKDNPPLRTINEEKLYHFYYSTAKIYPPPDYNNIKGSYVSFNTDLGESEKIERCEYIDNLIAALHTLHKKKKTGTTDKMVEIENVIHILQMLNRVSLWDKFRNIFVPDNAGHYTEPRTHYIKETDIIMTTLPNPLGFAIDQSSNVLHNTQFEIVEKFPGDPLDGMLHAFYNVENDFYLKMLLGDGKKESAGKLKRIMDANKKSQKDVFSFANSNPIIKKEIVKPNPTPNPK